MKLWMIAGSSSGVGKTTLARNLAEILPDSTLMKIGHGKTKRDKTDNFFTDIDKAVRHIDSLDGKYKHCIIESNRLLDKMRIDLVIFLNSLDYERRPDSSHLKRTADIIIGKSSNQDEWREKLGILELPAGISKKIIHALEAQNEYLSGSRLVLKTKIWFTQDGQTVFGEGLARLLRSIESHGSLSKAAKYEGISYRHAWGNLKKAEERLGFKLIDRQTGGLKGGGSKLTPKARNFLVAYEMIKRKFTRESSQLIDKFMK